MTDQPPIKNWRNLESQESQFVYTQDPNWNEKRTKEIAEEIKSQRANCGAWIHKQWEDAWNAHDTKAFLHWTQRIREVTRATERMLNRPLRSNHSFGELDGR